MKKVLLSMTMMAALFLSSCGGDASEEATGEANANSDNVENNDDANNTADNSMDLCDCFAKAKDYPSEEEARTALGDDVIDHCMDLMKNATDEEMMDCMGMDAPEMDTDGEDVHE